MKAWQLVVLALIFVGLVLLYFLEQRPQSRENAKVFITLLPELKKYQPDQIEAFSRSQKGPHLILRKDTYGWSVRVEREGKPFWTIAKQSKVDKLIQDLSEFTGELRAAHHSYLEDFGLGEKQGLEILLKKDGKEITTLVVGKKGPGWGSCFVKRDDEDKVYLVSRDLLADFDIWTQQITQPLQIRSWIDLQVIKENATKIKSCGFSGGKINWTLEKRNKDKKDGKEVWVFVENGVDRKLKPSDAQKVLGQFFPLYAKDVAPPETFEEKSSGKGQLEFNYISSDTGQRTALHIGKCLRQKKVCLVKDEMGHVFQVDEVFVKRLKKPLDVLKEKKVAKGPKKPK